MTRFGKTIANLFILFGISLSVSMLEAQDRMQGFPGAEGFGAYSAGGRGGQVYIVTNLNDDGPGSLRDACEAPGPRTIIFSVDGLIELKSPLEINEPYLTIAGQSAPGNGICLKDYGLIIRDTHDIVVRYLRIRPGDGKKVEQDALSVYTSQRVIIDHCSTSWGTDETLSVTGAGTTDVTVQWCIISESLNNSVHHKGAHGYGSLIRVDGNVSFHHNLYASHNSRNPRPGCYGDFKRGSFLDFRNNVIYNWGHRPGYSSQDKTTINYINNYLKPGPSTHKNVRKYAFMVGSHATSLYLQGNILEGVPEADLNNWMLVGLKDSMTVYDVRLPMPEENAHVTTEAAREAFQNVLSGAGATLPRRDSVDTRILASVLNNNGRIIDSQSEVGGWPEYSSGEFIKDKDKDGLTDSWESRYGFDAGGSNEANLDPDEDGYTNIEEYLNNSDPLSP